jgi:undecaprenyl-diphosphatase
MTFVEAILLGLIQGLTEFIPVSSTAHIAILARLFGISTPGFTFEVLLHLASLLAVVIYFWRDLWQLLQGNLRYLRLLPGRSAEDTVAFRFACLLGVGTVITGVLGLLLEDAMGDAIKAPRVMAVGLLLTAVLLVLVERMATRIGNRKENELTWMDGILVGLAQTVAVIPGISRSGSTLIAGLALGMARETAVRFSFLLAIPVLLGSAILAVRDISSGDLGNLGAPALGLSFLVSFIASMVSIAWLIRLLKQQRLYWFSIYLVLLAAYAGFFL